MSDTTGSRVPGDDEDDIRELDQENRETVDDALEDSGIPGLPEGTPTDGNAPLP